MERTTDHGQETGKLYHLRLRVECTLFCNIQSRAQTEFEDTNLVIRICISQQTTQWPKEKVENDNQPSTKHTYKTNDRVTRIDRSCVPPVSRDFHSSFLNKSGNHDIDDQLLKVTIYTSNSTESQITKPEHK